MLSITQRNGATTIGFECWIHCSYHDYVCSCHTGADLTCQQNNTQTHPATAAAKKRLLQSSTLHICFVVGQGHSRPASSGTHTSTVHSKHASLDQIQDLLGITRTLLTGCATVHQMGLGVQTPASGYEVILPMKWCKVIT